MLSAIVFTILNERIFASSLDRLIVLYRHKVIRQIAIIIAPQQQQSDLRAHEHRMQIGLPGLLDASTINLS
jgi:hypothetical protein